MIPEVLSCLVFHDFSQRFLIFLFLQGNQVSTMSFMWYKNRKGLTSVFMKTMPGNIFIFQKEFLISPSPGVHSDSRPSSQWCNSAISSSVIPFSSCTQSLPVSEFFPMSQLFTWGGQNTGVSALASFLSKKSQSWSPSEWTGWISLQSKGLSRVFSNTTVQKHQFFSAQPSSQSNFHIHLFYVI